MRGAPAGRGISALAAAFLADTVAAAGKRASTSQPDRRLARLLLLSEDAGWRAARMTWFAAAGVEAPPPRIILRAIGPEVRIRTARRAAATG